MEYRPLEDTVDPTNMLCAGKVRFMSERTLSAKGGIALHAVSHLCTVPRYQVNYKHQ